LPAGATITEDNCLLKDRGLGADLWSTEWTEQKKMKKILFFSCNLYRCKVILTQLKKIGGFYGAKTA
jgi:hypothetical protein